MLFANNFDGKFRRPITNGLRFPVYKEMVTFAVCRMKIGAYILTVLFAASFYGCMDYGPTQQEDFDIGTSRALFITNEGNFMYDNASLSYYDIDRKKVSNEVFVRSNAMILGDVAQSMSIRDGRGYIVVNNSGVIFVIDTDTFKVLGVIDGLTSPRYIHFLSDKKAYVTDLYAPCITVFNPQTLEITGRISTGSHKSTEQMVQWGKYVFTNCWSYDNKILVIDTSLDKVVDSITVGIQPVSLALDANDKLWCLTGGGYEGSPYGYEAPSLHVIDPNSRTIEREFKFRLGDSPSEICLNGTRDTLYFLNRGVWRMDVDEQRLPIKPFLEYSGTIYYGLAVDPVTSEVYVADAIDYVQPGVVYRFRPDAAPVDTFRVGIIPGAFCFK